MTRGRVHHGHSNGIHHHRSHYSHSSIKCGPDYMDIFDQDATNRSNTEMFSANKGNLTSSGSQKMFKTKKFASIMGYQSHNITQINLVIVGQKLQQKNKICMWLTYLFGILLIFPFFFMCCQWWKDLIHPKYVISQSTYTQIAQIVRKFHSTTFLNLILYDNWLCKQKIQTLVQVIGQSGIKRVSLSNRVLQSNFINNEYQQFKRNAQCFRKLSQKSCYLQWGTQVINFGQQNLQHSQIGFGENPQVMNQNYNDQYFVNNKTGLNNGVSNFTFTSVKNQTNLQQFQDN